MYRPLPDSLTIKKSLIEGIGLFTTKELDKNIVLGRTHILTETEIIRTPLGGFYNHSNNPNCMKIQEGNSYYLKTLRNIKSNEEITVKYTLYSIN